MKRVYFVRHAKSSWEDPYAADIDRPLNKRGLRDAPFMSQKLKDRISAIDFWVISPAKRAQMTAAFFKEVLDKKKIVIEQSVYHAGTETLVDVVQQIDDRYDSAIIFGHNPGYTYVYNMFSDTDLDNLPTCGIFELNIDSDHWNDMDRTNTRVVWMIYPKFFKH